MLFSNKKLEEKYARLQDEHKNLQDNLRDKGILIQVLLQNDAVKEAVTSLDLSRKGLTQLPPEIGQLTNLTNLALNINQLTQLPPEICQLTNLTNLALNINPLTQLPPEICQLTNLTRLELWNNQLNKLPPEIGQLTNLTALWLNDNQLTQLPPEIGQLTNLTELGLGSNKLNKLPPEIGQLTNLTELGLGSNKLTQLPPEIGQLTNLTGLNLGGNQLTQWPPEIGQLTNLTLLGLHGNQLTQWPPEIGQLTKLTVLTLHDNKLTQLPPEIGQLTNIEQLILGNEYGGGNEIKVLPPELGQLTKLRTLEVYNNPLESPPPEIVKQGTEAILAYLQAQLKERQKQWLSKLIIVGQGGVGKTSLLRVLRGETFNPAEPTTHGLETQVLELAHPNQANITMQLNTWDFGGQEIYHATHQFFLTNRALFLLVWHARLGFKAGELYYWLDMLTAIAPDSPILLVATHIDERDANLPLDDLRRQYPQLLGQQEISNKTGQGTEALQQTLAQAAAQLPLMGETWPTLWLKAAQAVRAHTENHITPQALQHLMTEHGIAHSQQPILTQWLHDLGDILYFSDNDDLADIVILHPQWVSSHISQVLESEDVKNRDGILTRSEIKRLWQDLTPTMRDYFLRLMEHFDLSYRDDDRQISLIVERLPHTPPAYQQQWDAIKTTDNCKQIQITFKLNTLPSGIPTWFIARAHRFTTGTHWRYGALLAHENQLALVQAFEQTNLVQLTVRGPNPQNFFALLKDGLELTLARYPGLQIKRQIPCLGHQGQPCPHQFNYEQLLKRYEKQRFTIECPETLEEVSVTELLYGWDWHTQQIVLERLNQLEQHIDQSQQHILNEVTELRKLTQREFTQAYRREQANIEAHCPNVFVLRPRDKKQWLKTLTGQTLELQLYCQAPGCWHPTLEGGLYEITDTAPWLKTLAPYLNRLIGVLKYATPLIGPWVGEINPADYEKLIRRDIETMKELAQQLPDTEPEHIQGAALRTLRHLLDENDPQQHWGGLKKVLTPEGHYLWLCQYHAREYQ
jgi:internalin A